jgi:hypothetical protein
MDPELQDRYLLFLARKNKGRQYGTEYNVLRYNTDEEYCESMKESSRKYYRENYEKKREMNRKYYQENKKAICEHKKRVRLAKKASNCDEK